MNTKRTTASGGRWAILIAACLVGFILWGTAAARADSTPDGYEDDDAFSRSKVIFVNLPDQRHNFHDEGDEDWVQFSGLAGETYQVESANIGALADSAIELYDTDGETLLAYADRPHDNGVVDLAWRFLETGTYYVRVRQNDALVFGGDTEYDLCVWIPAGPPGSGMLTGLIKDATTGRPIKGAKLHTSGNAATTPSGPKGEYLLGDTAGTYTLWVNAKGYGTLQAKIKIVDSKTLLKNFTMMPFDAPDLTVAKVEGPVRCRAGRRISVQYTVVNQGSQSAGPFHVGIYLSQDEVIRVGEDRLMRRVSVEGLPPNGILDTGVSVRIPADQPPGQYRLGVVADVRKAVAESLEDNNAGVSEGTVRLR